MLPPFLAGREAEQRLIRDQLDRLISGGAPDSFIILHGPRGNGKTALLEWSERQAESRKIRVLDVDLSDSEIQEDETSRRGSLSRWLRAVSGFSILGTGVNWREVPPSKLTAAIERRALRSPVLVAIDEAQTLPIEMGRKLFASAQRWQRRRRQRSNPQVLLLLAGTPDLPKHLKTLRASFWERSLELPIGRLATASSADAIRIPLEERGRSIAEDALERVVEESHGYPFFVQLWGSLLWAECGQDRRQLTCADLDRVRPQFKQRRGQLYGHRYGELKEEKLVPVAESVAEAFARSERRPTREVLRAAQEGLKRSGRTADEDAAMDVCDRLSDLGYIWPVIHEDIDCCEPGVPSLMRFVLRNKEIPARGSGGGSRPSLGI